MLQSLYSDCLSHNQQIPMCRNYTNCSSCISGMFRESGNDTYNCNKLVFEYTLNYAPAFITEIYSFLAGSRIIENIQRQNISILSLGGGIGTDYLAMLKYIADNKIDKTISYRLIDITPEWDLIRGLYPHPNMEVEIRDVLSTNIDFSNYDMIFMNKLYTTLVRNDLSSRFWTWFTQMASSISQNSSFIFHDNNSYYTGRDAFNNAASEIFNNVTKYYTSGHAYPEYIKLAELDITATTGIRRDFLFLPRMTESVFFVYRK